MDSSKSLKSLVVEVGKLILSFFKSYGIKDDMLRIPENVKYMGYKIGFMGLGMTVISSIFAFMLKATNLLITYRFVFLGICLFMLYQGQQVIKDTYRLLSSSEGKKFELIFNHEILLRGSMIIGITSEKVQKYDVNNNFYKTMTNETMSNCIKSYLNNYWKQKILHMFDVYRIISVIIMLVMAVVTNTSISQAIFIPMIIVFVILSFFCSAYISLNREAYYIKEKECSNEQATIANDLLRVPSIVPGDLIMRINRFKESITKSNENVKQFHKNLNISRLFTSTIEMLSQYGVIIFYLLGIDFESVTLATITEITATLVIVETALFNISRIAEAINDHSERLTAILKEQEDLNLILSVYNAEIARTTKPEPISSINIKPFAIRYIEESENDKPFTLIAENQINIQSAEVVILYGPSGSGKSTFMQMLTQRIKLEKSVEIPSTPRFMFYDENLRFGSMTIFEEIFCLDENPDLAKMQYILENLHLWSEIKANCFDVWQWMKEKRFSKSLSNGQRQRLILAKMLYWLDSEIDVMVLDECTSGLDSKTESDSADARRILEFIVRYCNKDKKRIVIISTHQDIDEFKERLKGEFVFRNLYFMKENDQNKVKEM